MLVGAVFQRPPEEWSAFLLNSVHVVLQLVAAVASVAFHTYSVALELPLATAVQPVIVAAKHD